MKLRSAQIGRPTWDELNETIIEYLKEARSTEYGKPVHFTLEPITTASMPTYQLTVKDAP